MKHSPPGNSAVSPPRAQTRDQLLPFCSNKIGMLGKKLSAQCGVLCCILYYLLDALGFSIIPLASRHSIYSGNEFNLKMGDKGSDCIIDRPSNDCKCWLLTLENILQLAVISVPRIQLQSTEVCDLETGDRFHPQPFMYPAHYQWSRDHRDRTEEVWAEWMESILPSATQCLSPCHPLG